MAGEAGCGSKQTRHIADRLELRLNKGSASSSLMIFLHSRFLIPRASRAQETVFRLWRVLRGSRLSDRLVAVLTAAVDSDDVIRALLAEAPLP